MGTRRIVLPHEFLCEVVGLLNRDETGCAWNRIT